MSLLLRRRLRTPVVPPVVDTTTGGGSVHRRRPYIDEAPSWNPKPASTWRTRRNAAILLALLK